ncbi:peptidylprolyl isomerase [Paraburkholderia terricola]|uniref:peptidylprolyl isomerase n=1 Tax=Paraburkholderia terricola TaxID=169427 RepID=A0ABU1M0R5_9BURK|nr:parvulin-like peptidyl-prolyl isomerase [Paraburkholderia terricola]MDR6485018.1 parvulin-like peptidyl-prolyl isomerase [Paraburkholderia terricola]
MKKNTSRLGSSVNMLCVTAFASVSLSIALPGIAHADDMNAAASQTGMAVAHPFGLQAAGASGLPQGVVARVNGVDIPATQLESAVRTTVSSSGQPDTPQLRQAIKGQLIARELFRQNAEKAHYDAKPEVQQAMNAAKVNAETQLYLKDSIRPEPVTDAQVKARYDQIVASLGREEYKPRVIAVPDEATATTVLAKLKSGTSFDSLARQYSVAPGRAAGGELPWVSFKSPLTEGNTQGLPLAVAQAITRLPAGGVTPAAIATGEAGNAMRVIVKVDAKRPTQVPSFDQAKDTIRQQLQALALEKAAAQFTGELMKHATIQQ